MCHDLDNQALVEPSLHYQTDLATGGNEPDPDDVADGIWNTVGLAFLNCTPSRINVTELIVRSEELPASGVVPSLGSRPVGQNGLLAVSEGDVPRELVAIVNIKSAAAFRSGRGYMTLPGPYSEQYITGRLFAGTYATNGHAFADLLDDSFSLGTFQPADVHPVVYSKVRRQRGLTPFTFRVTQAQFNTRPHWLRSRGTSP